jgi:hypothetical protein
MDNEDETKELLSLQNIASEKALLLLMRDDSPNTRYQLGYQRLVMGRGEYTELWILNVL